MRIVLASTENLSTLVEQGRLRREVYDRVGVVCLRLPPLRDRGHDVEALSEHFRAQFAAEFAKPVTGFTPDAARPALPARLAGQRPRARERHPARGRALPGGRVNSANLSLGFGPPRPSRPQGPTARTHVPAGLRPLKEALEEPEKQIIIHTLQALNWNRQETARVLDINRTTLYKKMKKYGLLIDEPVVLN